MHRAQFTHFAVSIRWGDFFSPLIAPAEQAATQSPHPVHFSALMENSTRGRHALAGHFLSTMWAVYSSRKYRRVVSTGLGALCPSPQS